MPASDPQPGSSPAVDPAINAAVDQILPILDAYIERYSLPQTPLELEAIIGAVLSVQADLSVWRRHADTVIEQVKTRLKPKAIRDRAVDAAAVPVAEALYRWRQQQQRRLFGVLNAYVQSFPEAFDRSQLPDLITTVIPMMEDWQLTLPEVRSLLYQIVEKFDVGKALRQVVTLEWLALAQKLANYRRHMSLEDAVLSTIQAYRQDFHPAQITASLVETAVEKVLAGDWDVDVEMTEVDTQWMVNKVMLKVHLLKPSPKVNKSAAAIAAQINTEIERFKREDAKQNPAIDATRPTRLGELEMGIEIHEA